MHGFTLVCLTPTGHPDPSVAIAATRAGAVGVFNAETGADASLVERAMTALARHARGSFGLKLGGASAACLGELAAWQANGLGWLVLSREDGVELIDEPRVAGFRARGGRVWLEVLGWDADLQNLEGQIDGWWVKGHEAGGIVGEETTLVLLQRAVVGTALPVIVRGGIGLHGAAACRVGGASGCVLDTQLLLLRESPLAGTLAPVLDGLAGNETVLLGDEEGGRYLRVLARHRADGPARAGAGQEGSGGLAAWLEERTDWQGAPGSWLPVGQDCALAGPWARTWGSVAGVLRALRAALESDPLEAARARALAPGAPLAELHGTRYPIVQGAMTRVSDVPAFALAVAEAGALPMVALAMLGGERAASLLRDTAALLAGRPWGVGVLGFVPTGLRTEQIQAIAQVRPPFAYIAGGRPDQAEQLEAMGIPAYLHVPTAPLLRLYLEQGARRFIFEGRECGGHIGPLSSLVLWETAVETLLAHARREGKGLTGVTLLFAGGIHDARSAAMVATLAAPLTAVGARIGVLLGTAYLFTREVVESGAILPTFQQEALACERTATLTTGTGHASRCAVTPFVAAFHQERRRLLGSGLPGPAVRETLDALTLGRLRVATKGLLREGQTLRAADAATQRQEGMYMIGQVATLRHAITGVADLHREVSEGANAWLSPFGERPAPTPDQARPVDIAVVGLATLLPGASDPLTFWDNIVRRVESFREVPEHRWDAVLYFDPDPEAADRTYSKWGGFLEEIPFDPTRYGMPPRSLRSIDPLQLLTLELVRRALEDAEVRLDQVDRARIGVVLGASGGMGDLGLLYAARSALLQVLGPAGDAALERLPEWTEDSFAGLLPNVAAGRATNRFDLGGLNCTVDAACASSLAAVYQAVSELQLGRADCVVAGGVDTMQSPFAYLCFAKTRALSPRGRCRTFDQDADGIVIAEGLAAVVLKRLADAERDGDRVYAVIKGVGASSDGRARGLTAPHPQGQIRALRRAYAGAGYSPATLGLVEAHGTGTVAGDRAELETVATLLAEVEAPAGACVIGSVKANVGHTKAAAGATGLVKAALALYHRVLPPHCGVERPLGLLSEAHSPLYVAPEARPWVRHPAYPRRAGVSAFGFGGTDFHVTLEEYEGEYRPPRRTAGLDEWPAELFLWRAEGRAPLLEALERVERALQARATPRPRDLAATLAGACSESGPALAIVADSLAGLADRVAGARRHLQAEGPLPEGVYWTETPLAHAGRLALLFPGQGAQYPGMLRELAVTFPALREVLDEADAILEAPLGDRLSRYVYPPERFDEGLAARSRDALTRTRVAQPALGVVGAALLRLVTGLGLRPSMAAGHSYGELTALHAAGVLDLPTLLRLSEARGRLVEEAAAGGELGTMLAVESPWATLEPLVTGIPGLVLANHNAPRQCVLSGTRAAVEQAAGLLQAQGVNSRPLPVAAAFHSPLVAPAQEALAAFMVGLPFDTPRFPVYHNATARPHDPDPERIRERLAQHLVRPVRFVEEIEGLYGDGARVFLELGPRAILTRLTRQILGARPHLAVSVDDRGGGIPGLLHALGSLWAQGVGFAASALFRGRGVTPLALDALEGAGRPEPLAESVWLVSGGGVRRPGEPHATGRRPYLTAREIAAASVKHPSEGENAMSKTPAAAPGDPDHALAAYQETMRRFLELQERVMTSYFASLGGEAPAGATAPLRSAPASSGVGPFPAPEPPAPPALLAATAPAPSTAPTVPQPDIPAPGGSPEPSPPGGSTHDLAGTLLRIASERTGYPVEMLGLQQDIEADLGIDSIKRVEILGALQKTLPAPAASVFQGALEAISRMQSFGAILEHLQERLSQAREGEVPERPFEEAGAGSAAVVLPRSTFQPLAEPVAEASRAPLAPGAYLLVPDARGVAAALARRIAEAGGTPLTLVPEALSSGEALQGWLDAHPLEAPLRGVVHLLPVGEAGWSDEMGLEVWRARIEREVKGLFRLLRAVGGRLRAEGQLLTASAMGGRFGRDYGPQGPDALAFPGGAGLVGLAKTLTFEWNEGLDPSGFRAKSVDLDPILEPDALAEQVWAELTLPGGRREVGYPGGLRTVFRTVPHSVTRSSEPLRRPDRDWVVLATGGARGITAECLRALAPSGATLVLVGRSAPGAEEDPATRGLEDAGALRAHLLLAAREAGETISPAAVERAVRRLLQAREQRANLRDLEALGARAVYRSADMRDPAAVHGLLEEVYATYGRIDAVIHGAGVIEDRLLLDKTPESWDRVIDTKLDSAFLLARYLRPAGLRFLAFFASVAGRYGNRGQADYAAANEVLNRLAWVLHARWPGTRVVAINWNPWDRTTHGAGMVTPAVRRQFEARGVGLVGAEAGRGFFWNEVLYGGPDEVELVAGDCPWEYDEARVGALPTPLLPGHISDPHWVLLQGGQLGRDGEGWRIRKQVDRVSDPYLDHHRLDGVPVMPLAVVLEYMAEAVSLARPGQVLTELKGLLLSRGLRLEQEPQELVIRIAPLAAGELQVSVYWGEEQSRPAYRATAVLADAPPAPPVFAAPVPAAGRGLDIGRVYRRWLFHGPLFQTVVAVDHQDAQGLVARLVGRPPAALYPPARGDWIFDPALLDGAVQTASIWSRAVADTTALPTGLGRIRRFGGRPPEGALTCHLRVLSRPGEPNILSHLAVVDDAHRLWIEIEDLRGTSSLAMNRVGGSWAGGTPGPDHPGEG